MRKTKRYRVEITVGGRKHMLHTSYTSQNAYTVAVNYSRLISYDYYRHLNDPDSVGKYDAKPHVRVRPATLN